MTFKVGKTYASIHEAALTDLDVYKRQVEGKTVDELIDYSIYGYYGKWKAIPADTVSIAFTEKGGSHERIRAEAGHQDLVPPFHNLPADG